MELTQDGKYLVTKEEFDFLNEIKQFLPHLRNSWFGDGRKLNLLVHKVEELNEKSKIPSKENQK